MRPTRLGIATLALLAGCGHYDLSVARPVAAAVRDDRPTAFAIDPLRYTVQSAEGHLVVEIYNPTAAPVELVGGESAVVDPAGESHRLLDRTIPPAAYVKLIEPPLRPWYDEPPGIPVGRRRPAAADETEYWDWPPQAGDVRLHLSFRGPTPFTHDLVFRRVARQ